MLHRNLATAAALFIGMASANGAVSVSGLDCTAKSVDIIIASPDGLPEALVFIHGYDEDPLFFRFKLWESIPEKTYVGDGFNLEVNQDNSSPTGLSGVYDLPPHAGTTECAWKAGLRIPQSCDANAMPECRGMSMPECLDGQWQCVPMGH